MNEFVCTVSVMGRCQCGETSCLVPPGGDSREQGDHICLPVVQEEKGRRNMNRNIYHFTIFTKNQERRKLL